ncbi:hypothetical protein Tco_1498804 [Tanacetum coccineum]
MCSELRSTSNSLKWEPMFILYCCRSMVDDYRLAGGINRAAIEVNNVVMQKDQFLEELDNLGLEDNVVRCICFMVQVKRDGGKCDSEMENVTKFASSIEVSITVDRAAFDVAFMLLATLVSFSFVLQLRLGRVDVRYFV